MTAHTLLALFEPVRLAVSGWAPSPPPDPSPGSARFRMAHGLSEAGERRLNPNALASNPLVPGSVTV